MKIAKITHQDISNFVNQALKSASQPTVDRKLSSLRKFFDWAKREGQISQNPVAEYLKNQEILLPPKTQTFNQARISPAPNSQAQSLFIARFAGKPRLQKVLHNIFYTRPKWYQKYHSLSFAHYLNIAIMVIFTSALGFGVYQQFIVKPKIPEAYPISLKTPKRYLSFQGRLTNQYQTPEVSATDMVFTLYDDDTGGSTLWTSDTCSVDPDEDGIFSVLLGTTSGDGFTCTGATEITSDVFSENAEVWLGVKVDTDAEATPRIQIATVAYALNSETLQGFPIDATGAATINTVLTMNNGGEIVIAETGPKIRSVSGTFAIQGEAITLQTASGTDGDINISPDGTGSVNITSSAQSDDALYITDSQTTTGALIHGYFGNDIASDVTLLKLGVGTTEATVFSVDSEGDTTITSGADLHIGTIGLSDNGSTSSGASLIGLNDDDMINISGNTTVQGAIKQLDTAISGATNASGWKDDGDIVRLITSEDRVGIGTTSPGAKLGIVGGVGIGTTDSFANAGVAANNLAVQGSVGIGTTSPLGVLDVRTGNVGLGTTMAPTQKLDIQGNMRLTGDYYDKNNETGSAGQVLSSLGGSEAGTDWVEVSTLSVGNADTLDLFDSTQFLRSDTSDSFTSGTLTFDNGTTLDVNGFVAIGSTAVSFDGASTNFATTGNFSINTTQLYLNQSTGNVGIGTSTPQSKLDVEGGATIGATYSGTSVAPANGLIVEGNVGIGVTAPSQKLEVDGNIKSTGAIIGSLTGMIKGTSGTLSAVTSTSNYVAYWSDNNTIAGEQYLNVSRGGTGVGTFTKGVLVSPGTTSAFTTVAGTDNYIPKWSNSYLTTTSSLFDNGNVGIGTTSPNNTLSVLGGVGIGSTIYTEFAQAPTNGLIVEGNVGIGTTSPQRKIHTVGPDGQVDTFPTAAGAKDLFILENNGNSNIALIASTTGVSEYKFFDSGATGTSGAIGYNHTGDYLYLKTNAYERMFINQNGNVGVGTSTPGTKFSVAGGVGIGTTDSFANAQIAANDLAVQGSVGIGTTSPLGVLDVRTGNVGLGTTMAPTQKLDIQGNIRLTGALYDSTNSPGNSNYYLQSTGTGTEWTDMSSVLLPPGTDGQTLYYNSGWTATSNLFNNGTNIGVGTTSPQRVVHAVGPDGQVATFPTGVGAKDLFILENNGNANLGLITSDTGVSEYKFFDSGATGTRGAIGYNHTADYLYLKTNALERVFIDQTGNMGIGTSVPAKGRLNVLGSVAIGSTTYTETSGEAPTNGLIVEGTVGIGVTASTNAKVEILQSDNTVYGLYVENLGGSTGIYGYASYLGNGTGVLGEGPTIGVSGSGTGGGIGVSGSSESGIGIYAAGSTFDFYANTATANNYFAGKVGIDTTSPLGSLDVRTGNVGLGTTMAPTRKLDVQGDVRVTGTLFDSTNTSDNGYYLRSTGTGIEWTDMSSVLLPPGTDGQTLYYNSGWTATSNLFNDGTNIGIGTTSPKSNLSVGGEGHGAYVIYAQGNGGSKYSAVVGISDDGDLGGYGVYGVGGEAGVSGESTGGFGVLAWGGQYDFYAANDSGKSYFAGNVGIGVPAPTQKLHVSGNMRLTGLLYDVNNEAGNDGQILSKTTTGVDWVDLGTIGISGTGTANYIPRWASSSSLTNSSIYDDGTNVGIGLTNPSNVLDVYGGDINIAIEDNYKSNNVSLLTFLTSGLVKVGLFDYGEYLQMDLYGGVSIFSGSSERLTVTNTGNVGIGVINPSQKLDVVGSIELNQYLYFENSSSEYLRWDGTTTSDFMLSDALIPSSGGSSAFTLGSTSHEWWALYLSDNAGAYFGADENFLLAYDEATSDALELSDGTNTFFSVKDQGTTADSYFIGNLGIGTTSPKTALGIVGGVGIGTTDSFANAAIATNNLAVQGNIGIGTTAPLGALDVRTGNVGLGTTMAPTQKLDIQGNMRLTGALYDTNNEAGGSTQILSSTGSEVDWVDLGTIGISGTGTVNYIPKWNSSSSLTDSLLFDDGTNVGIGTTTPSQKLDVAGQINTSTYYSIEGMQALRFQASGNTVLVGQSGNASITGNYNNLIGVEAGTSLTNGDSNTFIGYQAGYYNQTGGYNTAIGYQALSGTAAYTSSDNNIAIGLRAGYSITSDVDYNTFLGMQAGYNTTTGTNNFFSGLSSGYFNQTGGYNTAIGNNALRGTSAYTGSNDNIAIGQAAGYSISSDADFNTFLGYHAGYSTSSGTNNFFSGYYSGYYNQTGTYNTAIGHHALRGTAAYTNSNNNIAIGYQAGYSIASGGDANTFLGQSAGYDITTGDNNIFLGYNTGDTLATGSNNIVIGYNIATPANNISNYLSIGNLIFANGGFGTGTTLGTGNIGVGITNPQAKLHIDGNVIATGPIWVPDGLYDDDGSLTVSFDSDENTTLAGDLYIDGNVGIGITSPGTQLQIDSTSGGVIRLSRNDDSFASPDILGDIQFYTNDTSQTTAGIAGAIRFIGGENWNSAGKYGRLGFFTTIFTDIPGDPLERMSIDTLGNVGIGTTVPTKGRLNVLGSVAIGSTAYTEPSGAAPTNGLIVEGKVGIGITNPDGTLHVNGGANSRFSAASNIQNYDFVVQAYNGPNPNIGDRVASITLIAQYQGTGVGASEISIKDIPTGNTESNMALWTRNSGGTRAEKMRITGNGNVGIGMTMPTNKLDVDGTVRVRTLNSGTYSANLNVTSTGVLTTNTSDIRLKKNIETIPNALDKVMQLRGVTFNWTDDSVPKRMTGMIAQETIDVMPELVFQNPNDDYYGIFYGETSGLLIEAIKEQQGYINEIQNQIGSIILTDTGDLNITKQDNEYVLEDGGGNRLTTLAAFTQAVIANISAGAISAKEVVVETSAEIAGTLKAGSVEASNIATDGFIAVRVEVDNLLVSVGLASPTIQTAMISPLVDEGNINIQIGNNQTGKEGKLSIKNQTNEEVASIDSEGNATFSGELTAKQLAAENTSTNTLTAQKIYTDQIVAKDGTVFDLAATNITGITREEIEAMLQEAEADQELLETASNWNIETASQSAELANIETANIQNLYVTQSAAMNSLTLTSSLSVGGDMLIQSSLNTQQLTVNSIDTLTAPLAIQSLAMAPVEIMAGRIKIDTDGNVAIGGNLFVAGRIESQGLTLKESETTPPESEADNKLLTLRNNTGEEVAAVSATGSAEFKQLASEKLVVAGATSDTASANEQGEISTNASAGHTLLSSGANEITIKSPAVTNKTLVYVTPTTSTQNNVLYVKAKADGYFKVGFIDAIDSDVEFNWWVIDTQ